MREDYEGMENELLAEQYITTKQELLNALKKYLKAAKSKKSLEIFEERSEEFREVYLDLVTEFYRNIEKTTLLNVLEPGWFYSCEFDDAGARLYLEYASNISVSDDGFVDYMSIGEKFTLVEVPTRLLTVEDYANIYKTTVGTVRQWIRRGKIRRAMKLGNEWRIPELCAVPQRGYREGRYIIGENLENIPEEFSYIKNCSQISILQSKEQSDTYYVSCTFADDMEEDEELYSNYISLSTKDREKLELYLISNNKITAYAENFATIEMIDEVYS